MVNVAGHALLQLPPVISAVSVDIAKKWSPVYKPMSTDLLKLGRSFFFLNELPNSMVLTSLPRGASPLVRKRKKGLHSVKLRLFGKNKSKNRKPCPRTMFLAGVNEIQLPRGLPPMELV